MSDVEEGEFCSLRKFEDSMFKKASASSDDSHCRIAGRISILAAPITFETILVNCLSFMLLVFLRSVYSIFIHLQNNPFKTMDQIHLLLSLQLNNS
jgi:hypothetical protein